ncbi:MAG TPA: Gfo/Idh/MocA family oxidoreductase [Bryobacteraceae bacterium]|jgi:predicted dehydrogenase|nr:Gfo/Idh/MocA family oxidoreductase [Bryobacteraceae bacterium]
MHSKLRIGVIGLGIMGEQYTRIYRSHPLAEVTAIATRNPERLRFIGEKYNVQARYTNYGAMLANAPLDAVCVATPDFAHYAPVKAALEAGLHVLCEKPFTTDLSEADELLQLSRSRPRQKLQVAFNHRWLGAYHQGFVAIQQGSIGTPVAGYARKNDTIWVSTEMIGWAAQSTPIHFLGAHDIDLLRWYFASEPVEAHAYGAKGVLSGRGIDTYDVVQAQLKFASGAFATIESGWIYPNTFPTITDSFVEVIGSAGHLHFDRKRESIELSTKDKFSYPKTFLLNEIFGKFRGAFVECLNDFVSAIVDDTQPKVTAFDGRQVTAVLDAVSRSLSKGGVCSVTPAGVAAQHQSS